MEAMDTAVVGAILGVGTAIVGSVVWLVRLEGRVNGHERQHAKHEERDEELKADFMKRHDEVRSDLTYIRDRIDRALNGKGGGV